MKEQRPSRAKAFVNAGSDAVLIALVCGAIVALASYLVTDALGFQTVPSAIFFGVISAFAAWVPLTIRDFFRYRDSETMDERVAREKAMLAKLNERYSA